MGGRKIGGISPGLLYMYLRKEVTRICYIGKHFFYLCKEYPFEATPLYWNIFFSDGMLASDARVGLFHSLFIRQCLLHVCMYSGIKAHLSNRKQNLLAGVRHGGWAPAGVFLTAGKYPLFTIRPPRRFVQRSRVEGAQIACREPGRKLVHLMQNALLSPLLYRGQKSVSPLFEEKHPFPSLLL